MECSDTLGAAYERADVGLYESKKKGRDRGYWLSDRGWIPFPTVRDAACEVASPRDGRSLGRSAPDEEASCGEEGDAKASSPTATGDRVLELSTFLPRLDQMLSQHVKMSQPAAGIMVEIVGLRGQPAELSRASWKVAVALVHDNLRDEDLVCLYRPCTLCIFLPNASLSAATGRAAEIQRVLRAARPRWSARLVPERFCISVGAMQAADNSASFLNQLEAALDEAIDASDSELVVHTGETYHFQEV